MAEILFPVGRMIGGSLYKAQPVLDNFGKPKLDNAGAPRTEFNFGVAIPKTPGLHWSQETWGAQIKQTGDAAYPGQSSNPAFAWKIIDGDSTVPNKKNRKPCDQEGYRGSWVLWFKQSWCPKLVIADGSRELTEPDAIMPGYFVQVFGSVKGNAPSPTPGVFLNPIAVALAGYGERIETISVDTAAVGFGAGPKPAGMSAVPLAGMVTPPANVSVGSPYGAAEAQAMQASGRGQVQFPPNPAILAVPPIPAAPKGRIMLPAANGATYEQMIGAGWNDALLVQHGMMAP
jgi:hypothetical protein